MALISRNKDRKGKQILFATCSRSNLRQQTVGHFSIWVTEGDWPVC